ncbi:MAG: hypothetical protein P8Q97_13900 [Myxococcota bacterium]|nr:hypothetical protein [Myxococcota bacterium]
MDLAAPPWSVLLFQSLAFWVALVAYRGRFQMRFLLGLGLGALLGRLGWILLFFPQAGAWLVPGPVESGGFGALAVGLLQPGSGASVLFLPLGPLLLGLAGGRRAARVFWASSARALAPALAMARLGCVVSGCCSGRRPFVGSGEPGARVWAYPTAEVECVAWLFVSVWLARVPQARAPAAFLLAFGGLRLGIQPLRAELPLGDAWLDPSWIALVWLFLGGLALGPVVGGGQRARPGSG